ncbi:MAG: hypothetical protein JWP97_1199 [Labilithrix sp.]|nr:hypothetical protein [Labilithrix sp.]
MRSKLIATGLVLSSLMTLVAVPAFADEGKGPSFPIPAAQFKQHVDARQAKARQHMEERASKLPANEAQALRAKFDENTAKVNAEVAKAIADGTVTKEEAHAVRAASPHHGKGDCQKKS